MTKMHFEKAAKIVRAILAGEWTNIAPQWAPSYTNDVIIISNSDRAVQTAEAFIILAQAFNPRFDTARFLVACGLATKATKGAR